MTVRICQDHPPTGLNQNPITGMATFLHPCITPLSGTGILTCHPSTTPYGLALGTDLPWEDYPFPGNLGLTANKFLTCFFATYASIVSCSSSNARHRTPSTVAAMLPYQFTCVNSIASVPYFSPVTSSAHDHLTSELLRFL